MKLVGLSITGFTATVVVGMPNPGGVVPLEPALVNVDLLREQDAGNIKPLQWYIRDTRNNTNVRPFNSSQL